MRSALATSKPSLLVLVAASALTLFGGCKKAEESPAEASKPPKAATQEAPAPVAAAPAPTAAAKGPAGALSDPAALHETAPAVYKAHLQTTKGAVVIEVHRDYAPAGADRFYNLVKAGYFTDVALFRVIKGFMVQFGIHGDPSVNRVWKPARISDDPTGKQSNTRGMVSFATSGPNTRTTQLFINYGNNVRLDGMGFTPIGRVVTGMEIVDAFEGVYGEGAPMGQGPSQGRMTDEGNTYLKAEFPKLDYIQSATIE